MVPSKPIQAKLERHVDPEKRPERHTEDEPRRAPDDCGRPPVSDEGAHAESKRFAPAFSHGTSAQTAIQTRRGPGRYARIRSVSGRRLAATRRTPTSRCPGVNSLCSDAPAG